MSQCHDVYEYRTSLPDHLPILVRDVMSTDPIAVEPTATVKEMAEILLRKDVRSVPVVDIGGLLVGVVSEADLVSREGFPSVRSHHLAELIEGTLAEHRHHWSSRAGGLTAGEIMTRDVVTCAPDEALPVVTRRMLVRDVRMLPVVQDGKLIGILSRHDLLRLFDRPDTEVRSRIAELLSSPLWGPEGHHVDPLVLDGVVTLRGTVLYPSDLRYMSSIVAQVPGVIEVVNQLTAEHPDPKPSYFRDTDWR
ncbi:MAG TPA: CBS domain-containing protein [Acidimicrobiales bacterium]